MIRWLIMTAIEVPVALCSWQVMTISRRHCAVETATMTMTMMTSAATDVHRLPVSLTQSHLVIRTPAAAARYIRLTAGSSWWPQSSSRPSRSRLSYMSSDGQWRRTQCLFPHVFRVWSSSQLIAVVTQLRIWVVDWYVRRVYLPPTSPVLSSLSCRVNVGLQPQPTRNFTNNRAVPQPQRSEHLPADAIGRRRRQKPPSLESSWWCRWPRLNVGLL